MGKEIYELSQNDDLELSTKLIIHRAKKRNIQVEILDRKENLLLLRQNDKIEIIKQASKTRLDTYISFLCMEDKEITKIFLKRSKLPTPKSYCYVTKEEALKKIKEIDHQKIWMIKPSTSNFGIGITKLNAQSKPKAWEEAIDIARQHSQRILIEEFIEGDEYRFFVIGDECMAICKRVPANVIGDGKKTIRELVWEKNQDPRRGIGHRKPLEKIQIGDVEKKFLKNQNLSIESIPKKKEKIFLRSTSNVSTGGDSLDYTDKLDKKWKDLAIQASKSVGACLCGVDIILKKEKNQEVAQILELNFNPTIYIHEYPFEGIPRDISSKILDLLGFN